MKNHFFHNIENLDILAKKKVYPLIQKFDENLDKAKDSKINKKEIKDLKKKIELLIQNEKSKVQKYIDDINFALNEIYHKYALEIQKIQAIVKLKFTEFEANNTKENNNESSCELLNGIVKMTLSQKTRQKDFFIIQILSHFDELNNMKFHQKPIDQNNIKSNFVNSLKNIKESFKKDLELIFEGKLISDIKTKSNEMMDFFYKNIVHQKLHISN